MFLSDSNCSDWAAQQWLCNSANSAHFDSVCLAFCATDAIKREIGESTQMFQDLTTDQEFYVEESTQMFQDLTTDQEFYVEESTQMFQDLTTDQEFYVEELLPKTSKFSWWTVVENQNSNDINKRLNYIVTITVIDEGDF